VRSDQQSDMKHQKNGSRSAHDFHLYFENTKWIKMLSYNFHWVDSINGWAWKGGNEDFTSKRTLTVEGSDGFDWENSQDMLSLLLRQRRWACDQNNFFCLCAVDNDDWGTDVQTLVATYYPKCEGETGDLKTECGYFYGYSIYQCSRTNTDPFLLR